MEYLPPILHYQFGWERISLGTHLRAGKVLFVYLNLLSDSQIFHHYLPAVIDPSLFEGEYCAVMVKNLPPLRQTPANQNNSGSAAILCTGGAI